MEKPSSYKIGYKVLGWREGESLKGCHLRGLERQLKVGAAYIGMEISSRAVLKQCI
jgi:hypothetical protein